MIKKLKPRTCSELGVCQGLPADQCPGCTSFECEVACTPEPPRTAYPFAPGVIQRSTSDFDDYNYDMPLSLRELAWVLGLVAVCSFVGGLIARWLA